MPFEIPEFKALPAGTYKATLLGVDVKSGGKFGDSRVWHWLVDNNGEPFELDDLTTANTGQGSVSYRHLTALLGRAPQAGEKIEDPTGKTVHLQISVKENGFNKVDAVIPIVEPVQTEAGIPR